MDHNEHEHLWKLLTRDQPEKALAYLDEPQRVSTMGLSREGMALEIEFLEALNL